jgi:acyl-CoA reductase-like NAD-dependent aldehyde dehydrogenase
MSIDRLDITKTYKLFIGGQFPRSEGGRSMVVAAPKGRVLAHIAHASRKDLRDAVEAARSAQPKWAWATAYNRGQVLYRLAEMMEGKRAELAAAIDGAEGTKAQRHEGTKSKSKKASRQRGIEASSEDQVAGAIDRVVCYAGWADKYGQVLGCNNPVAGPYYNFTVPEPTGVVGVIAPDSPSLLGLVSLIAPVICSGNAVVALASETNPIPAAILAEACATSDLPAGVVNILTGRREELASHFASHRDINAIHAAGVSTEHARVLREGVAENLKRVVVRDADMPWHDEACESPAWIEPFVEMKTIWHPMGA